MHVPRASPAAPLKGMTTREVLLQDFDKAFIETNYVIPNMTPILGHGVL